MVLGTAWAGCEGRGSSVDPAASTSTTATTPSRKDDVTLSGRVTAAYGAHIFVVGSGTERVIVVTRSATGVPVGEEVDVTGRVATFRRGELEAELGVDLGLAPQELENGNCLVASVARVR